MTSEYEMDDMDPQNDDITSNAARWFVRQQSGDMSGQDWLAFSDWLGEDERHARAFDAVVTVDDGLDQLDPAAIMPVQPAILPNRWNWRPTGVALAAIAASVLIALILWPAQTSLEFETIATGPGETRSFALDETTRIELNGATRIELARGDAPLIRLHRGEAAIFINASEPSKLRVEVGQLTLVDRGTSFDVIRDDLGIRLAVGSGQVTVNPDAEEINVSAGETLTLAADGGAAVRGVIAPEQMAGWREGRLSYRDTALPMLAADLGRALGVTIALDPALSQKRFTGVVPTTGEPAPVIAGAAALIGASASEQGETWVLSPL